MKDWSDARGRLEGDIQRKIEHQKFGNNFEKARGFVRQSWKSKGFNPDSNPLIEESSTDEDEYGNDTGVQTQQLTTMASKKLSP